MRFPLAILGVAIALPASSQRHPLLIIGIDGFSAEAVRRAPAPNIRKLMAAGTWTLHARGVMPTVSSPNWASIIMGAGPESHGVTSNEWQTFNAPFPPVCQSPLAEGIFPTLFGQVHLQRPSSRIGVIHDWKDFGRLFERKAVHEARHVKGSPEATDAAIAYWREQKPDLLFVHLDDVDHAGHNHEWHSEKYFAEVSVIDGLVGKLMDAADLSKTNILLVADHGGVGTKHGGLTLVELEVPWIAAGPGIPKRGEIPTPVSSVDTSPAAAALLGVKSHPCWTGRNPLSTLR
jgi:predicted AlkP superfamily pyrophosphatase or phosphodiesterase